MQRLSEGGVYKKAAFKRGNTVSLPSFIVIWLEIANLEGGILTTPPPPPVFLGWQKVQSK